MKYTFVLIHGSWHDGRAWTSVVRGLERRGHSAYAPTLAGHGPGGDKNVSHASCVQSVVEFVLENDLRDFVLAGHSFGGTIIQAVAERLPERIRRLVFCNAFVLKDGESLVDVIPPDAASLFESLVLPDGGVMLPFPIFREALMNDADEAAARIAYDTLSPTPRRTQIDKVSLKTFFSLQIPKSYLNCTDDTSLPYEGWHPGMSQRLGFYRLIQMPGSHEVMFTNAELFAQKILEAGRD